MLNYRTISILCSHVAAWIVFLTELAGFIEGLVIGISAVLSVPFVVTVLPGQY